MKAQHRCILLLLSLVLSVGDATRAADGHDLPNVLLIGDSISIGYTADVRALLAGRADVYRPMAPNGRGVENCRDSRYGLEHLDLWLGSRKWAVIHFNWGLWDLCYRGKTGRDKRIARYLAVPIDQYQRNLERLVERLEGTGAKLIWASTTVVPPDDPGRFEGDDLRYNRAAASVMARHHIPVDDLNAVSRSFDGRFFLGPGNVHYTKEGYARLAASVADEVLGALPSIKAVP